jgi:transcriptional regulator with XRE-family HTH domain
MRTAHDLDRNNAAIGVSFQQIQKYENGKNRISASRLFLASEALGSPIGEFMAETKRVTGLGLADRLV